METAARLWEALGPTGMLVVLLVGGIVWLGRLLHRLVANDIQHIIKLLEEIKDKL